MNDNTSTRLDPMSAVMHIELLRAAHMVIERGQIERYWEEVPNPKRPIGRVRLECTRQMATFAVPIFCLIALGMSYGTKGVLLGLPLAWFIGWRLDEGLQRSIQKKLFKEMDVDNGRYNAVKWLSEQMNMRREEVTLDVIRKMNKDFAIVQRIIDEKTAKYKAEQAAAKAEAYRRRHCNPQDSGDSVYSSIVGSAAPATGYSYHNRDDDEVTDWGNVDSTYQPSFNPASGLPMVGNTFLDVGGNVYGSDNHAC